MLNFRTDAVYRLPIKNGYLDIRASLDPEYPGLDIEYVDDCEEKEKEPHTRPRVLIECPKEDDILRALIWDNPNKEDYNTSVEFETSSDRLRG